MLVVIVRCGCGKAPDVAWVAPGSTAGSAADCRNRGVLGLSAGHGLSGEGAQGRCCSW